MCELKLREKLLVWPNYACVGGAKFDWLSVDGSDADGGETAGMFGCNVEDGDRSLRSMACLS